MTFIVLSLSPTPCNRQPVPQSLPSNFWPPPITLGFTFSMAYLCFLFPYQPFDKKPGLLSCSLLCTRYFGLSGTNLLQPRHRLNSFRSMPCSCGLAGLLPHTVLAPRTAAWAKLPDLGCTVWEGRHPSNETHSHLCAPAVHLSCVSWIIPSCVFVRLSGQSVLLRG